MFLSMALLAAVVLPSDPGAELKAVADKLYTTVVQVRAVVVVDRRSPPMRRPSANRSSPWAPARTRWAWWA